MLTYEITIPAIGKVTWEPPINIQQSVLSIEPEGQRVIEEIVCEQMEGHFRLLTGALLAGSKVDEVLAVIKASTSQVAEQALEILRA